MSDSTTTARTAGMSTSSPAAEPDGSGLPADLEHHPVILFDGVCGLCNHTIDFIFQHDHAGVFRFAPLQGETAAALARQDPALSRDLADLSTLIVIDHRGRHRRSSAVVRILIRLGTGWKILGGLLWLIPRPLRNLGYRLVSRYRYRLFGKKETCRLPTPEERARFLD